METSSDKIMILNLQSEIYIEPDLTNKKKVKFNNQSIKREKKKLNI